MALISGSPQTPWIPGFLSFSCHSDVHLMYSLIVGALLHRALISDVLDLSKIEAGRMEIETIPFDIREEVDSILSLFEEKVHQKRLEVSALVHDCVPAWIYGDPGRFRQILINLVGNAIKVCPDCHLQAYHQVMNIDRISDTRQWRGVVLKSTTTSIFALLNHNPVFLPLSYYSCVLLVVSYS